MSDTKCYAVDCYGGGFSKPRVAVFTIDRAMATFILKMFQIVRDNGLELVAKSTDLVWWFREDPRADLDDADLQPVVQNPALIKLNEDDEEILSPRGISEIDVDEWPIASNLGKEIVLEDLAYPTSPPTYVPLPLTAPVA